MNMKDKCLKELEGLPNVGPKLAELLYDAGYRTTTDFYCIDPDILFDRLDVRAQFTLPDRIRFILRAIVYWVSTPDHLRQSEKKYWWAWKDDEPSDRESIKEDGALGDQKVIQNLSTKRKKEKSSKTKKKLERIALHSISNKKANFSEKDAIKALKDQISPKA